MAVRTIALDTARAVPSLLRSHWFTEARLADGARRALEGRHVADVAIIGGGFVGLWTALSIKEINPAAKVVVLEQDVCGGGASGRNGGFAMSWWPKISTLLKLGGHNEAVWLASAAEDAVEALGKFCEAHDVDAHYRRSGWLWTATNEAQRDAWAATMDACARVGRRPFEALPADEIARRSGSPKHIAGVIEARNATVQPAMLAKGLKRVALANGVEIYERTTVKGVSTSSPARLETPNGEVTASTVVIATNVWSVAIPELSRLVTPVSSAIVVTEPIPERLREIGWTGGEAITDSQLLVGFYRTTRDGRIVYGKGAGAIEPGRRIGSTFSEDPKAQKLAEEDFWRAYPQLRGVKLEEKWSGPIDRTYDSLPVLGRIEGADHIVYGVGWSGNGVAPSYVGGKILAALALGLRNEWSTCALVDRSARAFPPEPIRYIGGNLVRGAVLRKERAEARGETPGWFDVRLAKFAPSGIEDKG